MYRVRRIVFLAAIVALVGCTNDQGQARTLQAIKEEGTLVVLTRNAPTTWYLGRDGKPTGPEYDMVEAFASHLGVDVSYNIKPSIRSIIEGIENGEGDLAAAGLTITPKRQERFRFGPPYQDVTQQVVCRRDNVQPESVEELVGLDITVIADSSYVERLEALKESHPELEWQTVDNRSTEQLLYDVWQREIDCTIADSNIVDHNRRYFPELIAPFNLNRSESLGWMMAQPRKDLESAVASWLESFRKSGRLEVVKEHYYGYFEVFDYVDTRRLIRRVDERYPKYRSYFETAAEQYDLPYILLSAQGYQESHWRARARSPTGVRGIMMLTLNTAKEVGVDNRLDPKQSIFGGAKYLAKLKNERFSDKVEEPDRTWLALAAYNVGRGHLHDAQRLAREQDLNPHRWGDVKQVLPLLSKKFIYQNLKYGYARGYEPVRYVQRIREYQHILENEIEVLSVEPPDPE